MLPSLLAGNVARAVHWSNPLVVIAQQLPGDRGVPAQQPLGSSCAGVLASPWRLLVFSSGPVKGTDTVDAIAAQWGHQVTMIDLEVSQDLDLAEDSVFDDICVRIRMGVV